MKVTKSKLKQIINEELGQELQELYIPFIGGKLPEKEYAIRRKQLDAIGDMANDLSAEEEEQFLRYASRLVAPKEEGEGFVLLSDRIEAGLLGQLFQQLRRLLYDRHPKHKAQSLMNRFDQNADRLSKELGGLAQEIADQKADAAAREKAAREERYEREQREEEEEKARARNRRDAEEARSAQEYLSMSDAERTRLRKRSGSSSHRVNPGFAGSGNMGYGESLDRRIPMKVTKAQLQEIILEELTIALDELGAGKGAGMSLRAAQLGGTGHGKRDEDEEYVDPEVDPYEKALEAPLAEEEDDEWIQDAEKDIKKRGTEGVCTGDKFGGPTCKPGTKRYNLAKTFRKMAKDRKK